MAAPQYYENIAEFTALLQEKSEYIDTLIAFDRHLPTNTWTNNNNLELNRINSEKRNYLRVRLG